MGNFDVAGFIVEHITDVDTKYGNLSPGNDIINEFGISPAVYADFYFCTARSAKHLSDLGIGDLNACYVFSIHLYNTVTAANAKFFGRSAAHGRNNHDGILLHVELNPDAIEVSLERLIHGLQVFCRYVRRVRVEL